MKINFFKYQGTGNDFVILDNRQQTFDAVTEEQIRLLCDRRFGVGGDGLMMLNKHPQYDFEMKYFNANGKGSTLCGNGSRCLVRFAYDSGLVRTTYRFLAADGAHEAEIEENGWIALKMNDVDMVKEVGDHFILDTGSPHYVKPATDVMRMDVYKKGREVRYSKEFEKEGINVNFVEQLGDDGKILVRTYERGVEDETYSCGTGVTASALVSYHNDIGFNHVQVQTKGGMLSVEFDKHGDKYSDIWLSGPAEMVFEGIIELKEA
jgi:diaminopimelate epimerase